MSRPLLVLGLGLLLGAAGCSKKRVAECDEFVRTSEKLAACTKLPEAQRSTIRTAATQIKDVLQKVDDAGGFDQAPKDVADEIRQACKSQNARIIEEMSKAFPECLQ